MEPYAAKAILFLVAAFFWTTGAHALGYRRAMKDALRIYEADRDEPTPTDH